jgi:hypothetical protein
MAGMKFLCDADRCIECNACVTACKNENEVLWGINRRRVFTINDGKPGERSVSMACMHCTDARRITRQKFSGWNEGSLSASTSALTVPRWSRACAASHRRRPG